MSLWKWSRTAASNDTADSTINLREGQAPSTLNDSARAMMAAMAKYRDDISGSIATGGTSTAFTVTTNQGLTALTDGFVVAFTPHTTSGASPTLNVDSLGAKAIRGQTGQSLPAGTLIASTPYVAVYNSSNQEWMLHGYFSQPSSVPIGAFLPYCSTTAPNSLFVLPYGQAISRTTYATLFTMISTTFGTGDGSTTFNLPDLRGRGFFGLDNMGGSTAGRITNSGSGITGTTLGAAGGAETVTLAQANLPNATLSLTGTAAAGGAHGHAFRVSRGNGSSSDSAGGGFLMDNDAAQETQSAYTGAASSTLGQQIGGAADHTHSVTGTTASINGNTTQTAVNKMPPAMVLPIIMRVI